MADPLPETPRVVVKAVGTTEVRVVLVGMIRTERVVVADSVDSVEAPTVVVTMAAAVVLTVTVAVVVTPVAEDEDEEPEPEPPVSLKRPEKLMLSLPWEISSA